MGFFFFVVCLFAFFAVCKFKAHKRCAVRATNNCKWTTLASIGKDIIEDEDGVSPVTPCPLPSLSRPALSDHNDRELSGNVDSLG